MHFDGVGGMTTLQSLQEVSHTVRNSFARSLREAGFIATSQHVSKLPDLSPHDVYQLLGTFVRLMDFMDSLPPITSERTQIRQLRIATRQVLLTLDGLAQTDMSTESAGA